MTAEDWAAYFLFHHDGDVATAQHEMTVRSVQLGPSAKGRLFVRAAMLLGTYTGAVPEELKRIYGVA